MSNRIDTKCKTDFESGTFDHSATSPHKGFRAVDSVTRNTFMTYEYKQRLVKRTKSTRKRTAWKVSRIGRSNSFQLDAEDTGKSVREQFKV